MNASLSFAKVRTSIALLMVAALCLAAAGPAHAKRAPGSNPGHAPERTHALPVTASSTAVQARGALDPSPPSDEDGPTENDPDETDITYEEPGSGDQSTENNPDETGITYEEPGSGDQSTENNPDETGITYEDAP
jgi:hypothetical protein